MTFPQDLARIEYRLRFIDEQIKHHLEMAHQHQAKLEVLRRQREQIQAESVKSGAGDKF